MSEFNELLQGAYITAKILKYFWEEDGPDAARNNLESLLTYVESEFPKEAEIIKEEILIEKVNLDLEEQLG